MKPLHEDSHLAARRYNFPSNIQHWTENVRFHTMRIEENTQSFTAAITNFIQKKKGQVLMAERTVLLQNLHHSEEKLPCTL